ncbi:hypothetical protein KQ876_00315 [Mycoplasma sp. CSL7491-lung]|uniref:hypothetical protein n=1 Tax=Mycoplasma sp. CSL7491-lung TaxID=549718 RepID=UPI001C126503|nr:hypothetical protein [Mycoplasma sp. CSL7491-lung]MBU4692653.1 hypothetical protein [Mycoplasma sp. CSL7491-lung]
MIRIGELRYKIYSSIIYFFVAATLLDHLVIHFLTIENFSFQPKNLSLIFTEGWWKKFGLSKKDYFTIDNVSVWNNIGVFFDTLINILYIPFLSPILPIFALALITFSIFSHLTNIKFRQLFSNKKITLSEKVRFLKNENNDFIYTKRVKDYYDFLFYAARHFVLDFKNLSYSKLEKIILKKTDSKVVEDFYFWYNDLKSKTEEFDYNIENRHTPITIKLSEEKEYNHEKDWLDEFDFQD